MERKCQEMMNKSQCSYFKPFLCTPACCRAQTSHHELNKPPPLFSQVREMERKEKWTQKPDGVVNCCCLTAKVFISSGGKRIPPFNPAPQRLCPPYFSLFKYSIKVVLQEFWSFSLSISSSPSLSSPVITELQILLRKCFCTAGYQRKWSVDGL